MINNREINKAFKHGLEHLEVAEVHIGMAKAIFKEAHIKEMNKIRVNDENPTGNTKQNDHHK